MEGIISIISPFLEQPRPTPLKISAVKAVKSLSKMLIKLYEEGDTLIDEDFKISIMKQREKLISKLNLLFIQEKTVEIKFSSLEVLALISRIDPPLSREFYLSLVDYTLSQIPVKYDEKYKFYAIPLEKLVHTMLHHNEIKSVTPELIKVTTWWETLALLLMKFRIDTDKQRISDEYINSIRKMYMELVLNVLNKKKIVLKKEREKGAYLTALMEQSIWCSYQNEEVHKLATSVITKMLVCLGIYESIVFLKNKQFSSNSYHYC